MRLTPDQHAPRIHQLGPKSKKDIYDLDGDQALSFKSGEIVDVLDGAGKLNRQLFADVAEIEAAEKAKAEADAEAEKAAAEAAEIAARAKADADEAAKKAAAQSGTGQ
ncbi:hypothetical protein [Pseudorhodobacter sp.]|uniref:hypothetical protein n=1 Tax=Pseudorhodobacter sp. TaxID=1934400 RepID=UPI00264A4684|nr:hypothetical protein [Pseudorhodobacter sp.]MDN5786915.1 hypothetical protein [Pseudorhodobacter sp.]